MRRIYVDLCDIEHLYSKRELKELKAYTKEKLQDVKWIANLSFFKDENGKDSFTINMNRNDIPKYCIDSKVYKCLPDLFGSFQFTDDIKIFKEYIDKISKINYDFFYWLSKYRINLRNKMYNSAWVELFSEIELLDIDKGIFKWGIRFLVRTKIKKY